MSIDLEFEGKDVSEAVEKACFAHQVTEAELDYEVNPSGKQEDFRSARW